MRRAAKRDTVEPAIIRALEDAGATVAQLSGDGLPDLLVRYRGQWFLLECKSPGGSLTEGQLAFARRHGWSSFRTVGTPAEATDTIMEA